MSVLSMFQSADFYFSNGKMFFKKKEYFEAILYLRKAVEIEQSEEHLLELALTYSQLGAFSESIPLFINLWEKKKYLEYSLALARDCRQHAFMQGNFDFPDNGWLIPNSHKFKTGEIPRLAQFWENINYDLLEELSAPSAINKISSIERDIPYLELILIDTISRRNLKRAYKGYDYYVKGNYDKAISTCMQIEKHSDEHEIGLEIIARAALENGDNELAENSALELLEIDKQNTTPYDILLKLYKANGLIEEKGSFIRSLINELYIIQNSFTLKYLAISLSSQGFNDFAVDAAEKVFEFNNMDISGIACYIGVLINSGEIDKAKKISRKYTSVFPNCLEITFLNWYVDSKSINSNDLYFTKFFSSKVSEELISDYEEEFSLKCQRKTGEIYMTRRAYDLLDVIFAFQQPQPIIHALSLNNSNEEEQYQQYLINKLKNIDIKSTCKATILFSLLISYRKIAKKITFPYDASIISGFVKSYSFANTANGRLFKEVYAAVYTYLLLHEYEIFSEELKAIIDSMQRKEKQMKSYGALCSTVLYKYAKSKDKELNLSQIAKIFGTNQHTFKKYVEYYWPEE